MPTFSTTSNPSVVITAPVVGATVSTTTPFLTWQYGSPAGRAQATYELDIFEAGVQVYNGTATAGAVTSLTIPGGVLISGHSYTITISVVDTGGFGASASVSVFCMTSPPAAPTGLVATPNFTNATVQLSWVQSVISNFLRYEITRTTSWEGVVDVIAKISSQVTTSWVDWYAPSSGDTAGVLTYSLRVVQNSGGVEVTSSTVSTTTTLTFTNSWITDIVDPTYRVQMIDNPSRQAPLVDGREFVQYWGDARPTAHVGQIMYETMTLGLTFFGPNKAFGATEDNSADRLMLRSIAKRKNTVCYRDGRGRHLFGSFSYSETDSLPHSWSIQLTFTETERPDGVG